MRSLHIISSMLPPGNGKSAYIPDLQNQQIDMLFCDMQVLCFRKCCLIVFRYQACAQYLSIRAPHGGVPPGDAHGGNAAGIHVLRRLEGRDKSVSFGEYPGPLCRSWTLAWRSGAGRAGKYPLRRRIQSICAHAVQKSKYPFINNE